MLETLIGLISSSVGGSVIGLAGNWLKANSERKSEEAKLNKEIELEKLSQANLRLESSLRMQEITLQNQGKLDVTTLEAGRAQEVSSANLQEVSYTADKASYGIAFVDGVRGLTRPILTLLSVVILSWLAYHLTSIVDTQQILTQDELAKIYNRMLDSVIFLSTASFTWWFGSRPSGSSK